jgi:hypothetical protein
LLESQVMVPDDRSGPAIPIMKHAMWTDEISGTVEFEIGFRLVRLKEPGQIFK